MKRQETFGERLDRLLTNSGKSTGELVKGSRGMITHQHLHNWRSGRNLPNSERLLLLAKFLGVSLDELVEPSKRLWRTQPAEGTRVPLIEEGFMPGMNVKTAVKQRFRLPDTLCTEDTMAYVVPPSDDSNLAGPDPIMPHDVLILEPNVRPKIGDVVIASSSQGKIAVGAYVYDDGTFWIEPSNAAPVRAGDYVPFGHVYGIIRSAGDEVSITYCRTGLRR